MPKTYTVKQIAEILGFSTNTVYKYLEEGKISAIRLGAEGRFRIPESELTKFIGVQPVDSQPQPITPLPAPAQKISPRYLLVVPLVVIVLSLIFLAYQHLSGSRNLNQMLANSPVILNQKKLLSAKFVGSVQGTVILPDHTFSSYKIINAKLNSFSSGQQFTNIPTLEFPSQDTTSASTITDQTFPFTLKNGETTQAQTLDKAITLLQLVNGQTIALKLLEAQIIDGQIHGYFIGQTLRTGNIIAGEVNSNTQEITQVSVSAGAPKVSDTQTMIVHQALSLNTDYPSSAIDTAQLDWPKPSYNPDLQTWSFEQSVTSYTNLPSTAPASTIIDYFDSQLSPSLNLVSSVPNILDISTISGGYKFTLNLRDTIDSDSIINHSITSSDLADSTVDSSTIVDYTITNNDISSNTINTGQLSSSLIFGGGQLIDLSAVDYTSVTPQGLILPNSSASPFNPSSGKGHLSFDTVNNRVIVYNGSSWNPVGSNLSLHSGSASTSTLTSSSGLELLNSSELSLIRGCSNAQVLKWNIATHAWQCGDDAGSAGTGISTIKENNISIVTSASSLDFTGTDFIISNAGGGQAGVAIDYANGQAAGTAAKGFLTAADWNTFNSKQSVLWQKAEGALSPAYITDDLLIGAAATGSAKFSVISGSGNTAVGGTLTVTGATALNGNTTLGDTATDQVTVTGEVLGSTPLTFEGTTNNDIYTIFSITDPTVSNKTITFPNASITVNAAADISGTTLASGVITSSLTTVGALASGSIATGFGAISTANNISTTGTGTITSAGVISGPTTGNTINGLIINTGAVSGVTGYTQASGNFALSGTGTFTTNTGTVSLNGDTTVAAGKLFTVTGGAGNPTNTNGTLWYDTTANKYKVVESGTVKTLCNTTDLGCGSAGAGIATVKENGANIVTSALSANFAAGDFVITDETGGQAGVAIDYANGQAADTAAKGFLTAADWNTFNSKQSVLWQKAEGALSPAYITDDLLIGAAATGSAKFSVISGSGNTAVGGTLTVTGATGLNGNTTLGDTATDQVTVTGEVLGSTPLTFEGTTNNDIYTIFSITDPTVSNKTITFPNASITVNAAADISGTTLASGVITSSLTTVGALASGSIATGFGAISTANNISTTGTGTITSAGVISGPTTGNTINGLIINTGAVSGVTGYTQASGNFALSGTGTFTTNTGTVSLNGDTTVAAGKLFTVTGGAGNPTNTNGTLWYDTTANKYKVVESGTVKTLCNTTDLGCGSAGAGIATVKENGANIVTSALSANFAAGDFVITDETGGQAGVAIDYANGQAAGTAAKGFLTAADWNTFNSKQSVLWQKAEGALSPAYITDDLLIGAAATGSAKFSVISGSGNTAVGGTLTVTGATALNGNTTLGDTATDQVTVTGEVLGSTPLTFEGTTNNDIYTIFSITDPTVSNKTITFPNASITVNAAADISGTTLASGVITSSLTTVGALASGSIATGFGAISTANNISTTGTGTITSAGVISGPTTGNTINGLIINTGAVSGVTGYTQASGNFALSGTGTFTTNTGTVSLNGDTTVAAGKLFTVTGGAGNPTNTNGTLWYDTTANKYKVVESGTVKTLCNTTDLGCGSAGAGIATVKENGANIVTSALSANFAAGDFVITDETGGQAGVAIDYANGQAADTAAKGFLTAADWNTFNSKQSVLWQKAEGALSPAYITDDLLIGAAATGSAKFSVISGSGNTAVGGTLTVTGATALNGNTTLGDTATDQVTVTGEVLGSTPLTFEGTTNNDIYTIFSITDPTVSNKTITFPNASITVNAAADISGTTLASGVITSSLTTVGALASGSIATGFGAISTANNISTTGTGTITSAGTFSANGDTTLGDAATDAITFTGEVRGASPLTFEGTTNNDIYTIFSITDPTVSNKTITFPNASITVNAAADISGTTLASGVITSSLTTVGALASGSIATGFGAISTANNISTTGTGTITSAGVISGPTTGNTINGLIINTGAVSGVTGYTQASGNFALSGTGTFTTNTGTVSLNGDTTVAAGKLFTVTGGAGNPTNTNGTLWYDTTANKYKVVESGTVKTLCNTTDLGCGSAGAGIATVKENGANIVTSALSANFAAGDFVITDETGGQAGVAIDYANGQAADTAAKGFLTAADWNTFNSKQSVLWQKAEGALSPAYITDDLLIGAAATGSAKFSVISGSGNTAVGGTLTVTGATALNGNTTLGDTATDQVTVTGEVLGSTPLTFEGTTNNDIYTIFSITDPTVSNKTITFPNASITVNAAADISGTTLASGVITSSLTTVGALASGSIATGFGAISTANNISTTGTGTITSAGTFSANGDTTLGDAATDAITFTGEVRGASPLTFEGTTNNDIYTIFSITDPTVSNKTITFPNASITVNAAADISGTTLASGVITSSLTTVGALASGSIATGFGAISTANNISTTGTGTITSAGTFSANGDTTLGDAATDQVTVTGEVLGSTPLTFEGTTNNDIYTIFSITDPTVSNKTITFPNASITVNAAADISGTTLASGVITSSLTTVGALASGSIATGFGAISTANNISTTGTGTITSAGVISGPTTGNTINGLIINTGAVSGVTGYTQASGNFALSGTGTFTTNTGTVSLNGDTTVAAGKLFTVTGGAGNPTNTNGTLWYDTTANKYKVVESGTVKTLCNTTDLGCGSAGAGIATVKENGANIVTSALSANFAAGDFVITDETGGQAGVAIDYANGQAADTAAKGFLTAADWNTFNSKQSVLWQKAEGALSPAYITDDLLIGAAATGSAKFSVISGSGNTAVGGTLTVTGATALNGNTTLGDTATDQVTVTGEVLGSTPLTFEGTTNNDIYTIFSITDPTVSNKTITFPNASITVNAAADISGTTLASGVITSSLTTVGALASGSIATGFGAISTANNISTTGTGTITSAGTFSANGDTTLGDAATDAITFTGEVRGASPLTFEGTTNNDIYTIFSITDPTVSNKTITFPNASITVNAAADISGTTLASGVITSSLTTVGALASGSIATGFGAISTANNISTTGTGTITSAGVISGPTTGNTINGLIINTGAVSGVTGYTQASGNFALSGTGTFTTNTGTVSLNGDTTVAAGKLFTVTGGAGNPTNTNGTLWYDTTANKYKVVESGTVKTLCNTTDLGCGSAGAGIATVKENGANIVTSALSANFAAGDFVITDETGGQAGVAIDYANGQAAGTAAKGFLTAADWNTFNSKQSVLWQKAEGALSPAYITDDLLIGAAATGSAKFSVISGSGNTAVGGTLTVTGATALNGNTTLGDTATDQVTVTGEVLGSTPLTFEGTTNNDIYTIFSITDPTVSNKTITFPNASITVNAAADISGTTLASGVITSSLTTVGALASGSIATGFGAISTANNISTTGTGTITSAGTFSANGDTTLGDAATDAITFTGEVRGASPLTFEGTTNNDIYTIFSITDPTVSNKTITFPNASITVNAAADISGTTLASGVITSSLTTVGALASGSIATGFGAISTANNISTTGTGTITSAGVISGPTTGNTINGLIINTGAVSGVTGYTQASGNFALSGTGTFTTNTGTVSLNGDTTVAAGKLFTVTGGAGNPTNTNGTLWYDTTANKYKVVESGTVKTLCNTTDLGCGSAGAGIATVKENGANIVTSALSANFAAGDFVITDETGGQAGVAIDYANGQAADTAAKGFLTAADWNTFNSKQSVLWQKAEGALSPAYITDDLLIGAAATGSAKFSVISGSGNTAVGGTLTVTGATALNGNTTLGDTATDQVTVTGEVLGSTPLTFEGTTNNDIYTIFSITDPTVSNKTITFPNASITVNAAADISGTTLASGVITSSLTTVGALASGSIATGFGAISTANNISTTGTGTITSAGTFSANGDTTLGDAATDAITFTGEVRGASPLTFEGTTNNDIYTIFSITDPTVSNKTITFPNASITVNAAADISGTTLASGVITSSLTTVGALASGSIATGFGAISTANNISTTGTGTITSAGALAANGGITFDSAADTVGAHTLSGTIDANLNIITNIGSAGTDFTTSGALTISLDAAEASGALVINNSTQANSILVAQDNGTAVFTIADVSGTAVEGLTVTGNTSGAAVTIAATSGSTNIPLTINSKGAGALTLDPTGAGSIVIGSADVTAITFTTDNNAAADLNFTGGATFNNGVTVTGALAANGGITFDHATDTVGAHTLSGTIDANTNIITNIGNAATDFDTSGGLTLASNLTLNTQSDIRFADSDSSNWVAFQAPAAIGTNYTWTLPSTDYAGCFRSDGSGNMTIAACGDTQTQTFTTNSNYSVPSDGLMVIVEAWGGGGGGGGGTGGSLGAARSGGGGGGGGAYTTSTYATATFGIAGTNVPVTIGTGGTGSNGSTGGAAPSNGGFGSPTCLSATTNCAGTMYQQSFGGGGGQGVGTAGNGGGGGGGANSVGTTSGTAGTGGTGGGPLGAGANTDNSGGGGAGGRTAAANPGVGGSGNYGGGGGGASSTAGANPSSAGGGSIQGGAAGGGGGTCTITTCNLRNGGAGGHAPGASGGGGSAGAGAGGAGGTGTDGVGGGGDGGGGGANTNVNGGNGGGGGNGGARGGGGGGGGASAGTGTQTGGKGGNGGSGYLRTWTLRGTGADLAEFYGTNDPDLAAGDVVSIDPDLRSGVKKTEKTYDQNAIGIISTKPGLTLGDIDSTGSKTVLVALAGRVPVKVSIENGIINPGDLLTPSSIPGIAMKATKAGIIIGQSLTKSDSEGPGYVVAFIKNSYAQGSKLVELIPGLSPDPLIRKQQTLAYFVSNKPQLENAVSVSEITTDRLSAGLEVITPVVVTDELTTRIISSPNGIPAITFDTAGNASFSGTLTADKIIASQILGADTSASASAVASNPTPTPTPSIDLQVLGDLQVSGAIIASGDIRLLGRPTFNSDTGGYAIISTGADEVEVKFDREYTAVPIINSTIANGNDIMSEQLLLTSNTRYIITRQSTTGFVIKLFSPALQDTPFSWSAIAVSNPKTFTSQPSGLSDILITPTPAVATPSATVTPEVTPTPSLQNSPQELN